MHHFILFLNNPKRKQLGEFHVQLALQHYNKIILDEKVTETKYPLELEAGKYEHRVGLYNKFGKVYGFSQLLN